MAAPEKPIRPAFTTWCSNYLEEKVGIYAAEAAVRIAEALIAGTVYHLETDIQQMKELRRKQPIRPKYRLYC